MRISKIACAPFECEYQDRQIAYRHLFQGKDAEVVLMDLIRFCRYNDRTITDSGVLNAHLQGMQGIIRHIEKMIESEIMDKPIHD